jgi:hypothetical protein
MPLLARLRSKGEWIPYYREQGFFDIYIRFKIADAAFGYVGKQCNFATKLKQAHAENNSI